MSDRQTLADEAIRACGVLKSFVRFDPVVISTIHANLDIPSSDIDIICCYYDKSEFIHYIDVNIPFGVSVKTHVFKDSVVCNFRRYGFDFEIYGSNVPVNEQSGFIHFSVMKRLVVIGGSEFQATVRALKKSGFKTEPAIAKYLGLVGDPYIEVLKLVNLNDSELYSLVVKSN